MVSKEEGPGGDDEGEGWVRETEEGGRWVERYWRC